MKKLFISTFIFINYCVFAQQGDNFSLWFHNNMQQNPAAAGTNKENVKFFGNYRYQYFTVTDKPFETFSASIEGKTFKSKRRLHYLGIGGYAISDRSGDGKYSTLNINIPFAYHIFINRQHSISVGIAPGAYQRSIDNGRFNWENQWTGMEFDNTLSSNETFINTSTLKFNLSSGIYYNYKRDKNFRLFGGFAINHIKQQDFRFNYRDQIYRRYVGHAGVVYRSNYTPIGFSPNLYMMFQGPNRNIVFGSNIDFYIKEPSIKTYFNSPNVFSLGFYHRFADAIIVNMQYSTRGLTFAIAYDSNVSGMVMHSKGVGAVEGAVIWDIILNKKLRFIF